VRHGGLRAMLVVARHLERGKVRVRASSLHQHQPHPQQSERAAKVDRQQVGVVTVAGRPGEDRTRGETCYAYTHVRTGVQI
jgi:hypothetical protein